MKNFEIIPALDLIAGCCVRLYKGDFARSEIYSDKPEKVAAVFRAAGAKRLHIVDLEAARAGRPVNLSVVKKIIKKIKLPVQLGGGLRNIDTLKQVFEIGVDRAILGTAAFTSPEFLKKALKFFGKKIVVGLDAFGHWLAIRGWVVKTKKDLFKTARKLEEMGVARIIYTDTSRDGTLAGPNLKNLKKLAQILKIPVIASGGISSLEDILKVAQLAALGVEGVVVGKALYTGKVDLKKALKAINPAYDI
jgi:phosphoribosylformimino-5-aminoimidazole carboxamide ribotide isomerase